VEEFWGSASQIFSINRRADLQISEKDTGVLVQSAESGGTKKVDSRLMAYLIREGIIPAELSYGISPSERIAQDYLILSLANIVKRYGGYKIKEGSFREMSDGTISFVSNSEGEKIQLSKRMVIFSYSGGSVFPVENIKFIPGDKFFYHAGNDGAIDYLEKKPPVKGASNDRYSVNYTWDVALSREDLEKSINQKIPIGELIDLQEVRRGRSGRVIEMRIIGSAGEYTVKGLNIRNALQLKENLFTMDKRRTADGKLLSIAFSGKGWGHGVGLCQVGAYGMALRGKKYDEILKWYYSGIAILKAYN
jgi:stage II sporulation protein D